MVHNYHNTRLNAAFGVTISATRLRRSFPLFQSQPQKCPNGEDVLADLAFKNSEPVRRWETSAAPLGSCTSAKALLSVANVKSVS